VFFGDAPGEVTAPGELGTFSNQIDEGKTGSGAVVGDLYIIDGLPDRSGFQLKGEPGKITRGGSTGARDNPQYAYQNHEEG
jgi:hypothetical protein